MGCSRVRQEAKYQTISEVHKEKEWSIAWLCSLLKVSRASYYKWLNRDKSAYQKECEELMTLIVEYDERFRHILGYRRMTGYINHLNHKNYSIKFVRHMMKKLNIKAIIRRKKNTYTVSKENEVADNILARDFYATKPNQKWATDVTEFKITGSKEKLYLSAIIDLYDRSIVSYVISGRNDNKLVFDTFKLAMKYNPDAKPIFHSDRGFQYTSKVFRYQLERAGMTQSMSRVGRCIDNCPTEGLWGIIKSEMYYPYKFHSKEELIKAIEDYIRFYNNERLQERYGFKAPLQVRKEALKKEEPTQYPIAENKRIAKYYAQLEAMTV